MTKRNRILFFVEGRPVPQGNHRVALGAGGARIYDAAKGLRVWREAIAWEARRHAPADAPFTGAVVVALRFVLPRPKRARPTEPAMRRPDLSKLARAVEDALTGVLWHDDAQIVYALLSKSYADAGRSPGVEIRVAPLDPRAQPPACAVELPRARAGARS